ncbi:hypothetical protein [uncultured Gimesia sp.]|uniref:hypothetical protein n=1 Tax=uncultured Gimesia sp. TaxID=1678688 RepID=UPI0026270EAE|nr:hypothetical protein [uncultured Gimesia sp.]
MLQNSKRFCLFGLVLLCAAITHGKEGSPESNKHWQSQPSGKYEFLRFPYAEEKEAAIRAALPIRRFKLQIFGAADVLNGSPAVNYYIEFHVSGKALLHAISGTEKSGIYAGKISLTDYARLCLLYETMIAEAGGPEKFGYEIKSSHPVISKLTLIFADQSPVRQHRNDANFGDFKFWVFENVMKNIESEVKWEKVEAN